MILFLALAGVLAVILFGSSGAGLTMIFLLFAVAIWKSMPAAKRCWIEAKERDAEKQAQRNSQP